MIKLLLKANVRMLDDTLDCGELFWVDNLREEEVDKTELGE